MTLPDRGEGCPCRLTVLGPGVPEREERHAYRFGGDAVVVLDAEAMAEVSRVLAALVHALGGAGCGFCGAGMDATHGPSCSLRLVLGWLGRSPR